LRQLPVERLSRGRLKIYTDFQFVKPLQVLLRSSLSETPDEMHHCSLVGKAQRPHQSRLLN
jgi:hypothetical protein